MDQESVEVSDVVGDEDNAKLKRIEAMETELKRLLDERAASLGELIEQTVAMHKQIQQDVRQIMKQDEEEDALVRESKIRTEMAEKELQRNPKYEAFKANAVAGGGLKFEDWPLDEELGRWGEWKTLVTLTPKDCALFLSARSTEGDREASEELSNLVREHLVEPLEQPVYLKVCGVPLHDLSFASSADGQGLLSCAAALLSTLRKTMSAVSGEPTVGELCHVCHLLRCIQAQPLVASVDDALEKFLKSDALVKEQLVPAGIHGHCVFIAVTQLSGLVRKMQFRCFVVKRRLCAVEQKHPGCLYGLDAGEKEALQRNVQEFVEEVLLPKHGILGDNFVADLVTDREHPDEIRIEWLHKMGCDMPQVFSWETMCELSSAPPPTACWKLTETQTAVPPPDPPSLLSFLLSSSDRLSSFPPNAATDESAAVVSESRDCGSAQHADPASPASQMRRAASEQHQQANFSPVMITSIAVAATGFLAGYLAGKRN